MTKKQLPISTKNMLLFFFCLFLSFSFSACKKPVDPVQIEYTISSARLNFDATGGQDKFTVFVKAPAIIERIESLASWCQVSTTADSLVTVIVTVDTNDNYGIRNTSVVVNMRSGETITFATVWITQDGIEIPDWILIDSVKWATRNVGAPGTFTAKPEDAGMFYQWNRKIGWSATNPMINSNGGTAWDSSYPVGNTWEKANDPCPPGWRVPTHSELQSLANAGSRWTAQNGVNGRIFGSDEPRLFLPAAGYRFFSTGHLLYQGENGYYWNSTASSTTAWYLHFYNINATMSSTDRTYGFSVRCVLE